VGSEFIRLLLIEDNPIDARVICDHLGFTREVRVLGLCRAALCRRFPASWQPSASQLLRAILPQRIWLYISSGGRSAISTPGSAAQCAQLILI
jgi:hypothetical protein